MNTTYWTFNIRRFCGAVTGILFTVHIAHAGVIIHDFNQHGSTLAWENDWELNQTYIDALRPSSVTLPGVSVGNSVNHGYLFPGADEVIGNPSWTPPGRQLLFAGINIADYDANRSWSYAVTVSKEIRFTQLSFDIGFFTLNSSLDDHVRVTAKIDSDPEFNLGLHQLSGAQNMDSVLFDFADFMVLPGQTLEIRTYARGTTGANSARHAAAMDNIILSGVVIPEPGSVALLATGLVGVGLLRRRVRKQL